MPAFTAHLLDENGEEEGQTLPGRLAKRNKSSTSNCSTLSDLLDQRVRRDRRSLPHLAHGAQEVLVGLGQLDLVEQELHGFHGVELGQGLAEKPDLLELVLLQEELFLTGARLLDVDGGEDPLVHEAP